MLGPIDVALDATTTAVTSDLAQRLLAVLAHQSGRAVPVDRIAEVLWRERRPANEANALQAQVSKLRRLLPAGSISLRGE